MKNFVLFCTCVLLFLCGKAQQLDCDKVKITLDDIALRVERINYVNPDMIPLHFLFVKDLNREMYDFYKTDLPHLRDCKELNFNEIISEYDKIILRLNFLTDTLEKQNQIIDNLFFKEARKEFIFKDIAQTYYFLDRTLQYNPLHTDAILLKLRLLFDDVNYEACLDLLERLYNEAYLNDQQENRAMDFTALFYDKLYKTGDSLVKADKAADALEVFNLLERFCLNMPSNYCNDDYYHGILRSKKGVYESYLTIAKIARERGNADVERKFLQYAEEYRLANEELENNMEPRQEEIILPVEPAREQVVQEVKPSQKDRKIKSKPTSPVIDSVIVVEKIKPKPAVDLVVTEKVVQVVDSENVVNKIPPKMDDKNVIADSVAIKKSEYQNLIVKGLALCIDDRMEEAYKCFTAAKSLENCACFETDNRVNIMLQALQNVIDSR